MKPFVLVTLVLFLMTSCSFEIEKRRYTKGYHVSVSGLKDHQNRKNTSEAAAVNQEASKMPVTSYTSMIHARSEFRAADASLTASAIRSQPARIPSSKKVIPLPSVHQATIETKSDAPAAEIKQTKKLTASRKTTSDQKRSFMKMAGLLFLLGGAMFVPFVPRSKKLGYWALNHRHQSKGLLFALHSVIALMGFSAGALLAKSGYDSGSSATYGLTALASALALTYPHRKVKNGFFKNTYRKQKWFAFLLSMSGLMLFAQIGNHQASKSLSGISKAPATVVDKWIGHAADKTPDEGGLSDGGRVALSVVIIIACVLICAVIAGLSCALICSGQGALAAVLMLVGFPAVIIATVHGVKKLLDPIRKKRAAARQTQP